MKNKAWLASASFVAMAGLACSDADSGPACGFKPRSPTDVSTPPTITKEPLGADTFDLATDDVTGLQWANVAPAEGPSRPTVRSLDDAKALCAGFRLASHADWRLPTVAEAVNSGLGDRLGNMVTSQRVAGRQDGLWAAGASGTNVQAIPASAAEPFLWPVVCVRQNVMDPALCYRPGPRFPVLGGGLVTDAATGRTWTQMVSDDCAGLPGGTLRKPSLQELITLLDYSIPAPGPMVDPVAFPSAPTQLALGTPPVGAWLLDLSTGGVGHLDVAFGGAIFCVR